MKLLFYGTEADKDEFGRALSALPECSYREICTAGYSDYEGFVAGLCQGPPDGIVIAMDGADGMEGVIAAKTVCRDVPILWFSDDGGFGAQSYRLGCAYFHKKPISLQSLSAAFEKCRKQSICEGEIG